MNPEHLAKPKIVFFVGPTSSGKSSFALEIAERLNARGTQTEIINADSLQVYTSLNIGTAKPSAADRNRVTHHLFDIVEDNNSFNAGDYRRVALDLLKKPTSQEKIFFIVGGSGFYIQALYRGMFEAPSASEELKAQLKDRILNEGPAILWQELNERDPQYAAKINPNDGYRIQRGLEIILTFGRKMSEIQSAFKPEVFPFSTLFLGLNPDRDFLRAAIEKRTKIMLESGLVEEVQSLLSRGLGDWAPLKSIGYFEVQQFLGGQITKDSLEPQIVTHTLQLAKRQMTWFKRWDEIEWLQFSAETTPSLLNIEGRILNWLGNP